MLQGVAMRISLVKFKLNINLRQMNNSTFIAICKSLRMNNELLVQNINTSLDF